MTEAPTTGRRKWRVARAGALALVLGAATTWATAWGLAFRSVPSAAVNGARSVAWSEERPARGDGMKINGVRVRGYRVWGAQVYDVTAVYEPEREASDDGAEKVMPWYLRRVVLPWLSDGALDEEFRLVNARGWPLPAVYAVRSGKFAAGNTLRGGLALTSKYQWRYGAPSGYIELVTLPYLPVWAGMAADTGVYAGVWIGVVYGVSALRRRLRRGAGQCAKCGYDLSGTPVGMACPECGFVRAR
jgi:hypothetical protein